MRRERLTVVVDGGGSGCRLAAFDDHGELCATAIDGPASLSLGEEQAWQHIQRGLRRLAVQLGKQPGWLPPVLCLGLAGALHKRRRERFMSLLPSAVDPILVTDGHAQLLGATGGRPGACLAVGTGSVLHWLTTSGTIELAGGWGFPMGDEGSGAWLGSQAINAYLWHRDTRSSSHVESTLFNALEKRIGREVSEIQTWSTCKSSSQVASLAPIIVAAAVDGDEFADSILQLGAEQCDRLLDIAPDSLPIHIVGGLADVYRPRLRAAIQARITEPSGDVFSGLYALAKQPVRGSS